eukprot:gene4454-8874_t
MSDELDNQQMNFCCIADSIRITSPPISDECIMELHEIWSQNSFILIRGQVPLPQEKEEIFINNLHAIIKLQKPLSLQTNSTSNLNEIQNNNDSSTIDNNINKLSKLNAEMEELRTKLDKMSTKEISYKTRILELESESRELLEENNHISALLQKANESLESNNTSKTTGKSSHNNINGQIPNSNIDSLQRHTKELENDKRKLEEALKAAELKLFFLELGDAASTNSTQTQAPVSVSGSPKVVSSRKKIKDSGSSNGNGGGGGGGGVEGKDESDKTECDDSRNRQLLDRINLLERQLEDLSKKSEERLYVVRNENASTVAELKSKCSKLTVEKNTLLKDVEGHMKTVEKLEAELESLNSSSSGSRRRTGPGPEGPTTTTSLSVPVSTSNAAAFINELHQQILALTGDVMLM